MADTGVLFSPSLFDEDDLFGDAIYGASTEPTELPLPDIPNSSDAALHAVVSGNDYNDDKVGPVDPRDDGTLGEDISHEDILALLQALDEVPSPVEKYTDAQMLELLNATCPTVPSTPTTMFPLDLYKTFRTSSEGSSCSSSPASEGSSSSSEALPFPDPGPERGPEDPIEAHLRVSKKTLAVIEGMFEPGQLDELRESVSHNGARLRIESRPRHDVHIDLLVLPNMTTIISVIGWSHVSVVDLDWIFGRSTGICLPPLERLPVEPNYQPRLAQPSPPHLPAQLALPAGDLTYETSGGRKRKEREDDDDEPVVSTRRRSETRLEPSPSTVTMTVDLLESIVTDMNRFNWVGRNTVKWFCVTWERKHDLPFGFNLAAFVATHHEFIAERCEGYRLATAGGDAVVKEKPQSSRDFHDLVINTMLEYDWDAPNASKTDFYSYWSDRFPTQPRIENYCRMRKHQLSDLCEGFRRRSGATNRKPKYADTPAFFISR